MRKYENDAALVSEFQQAWQAPELCRKCVWFCPWNGQGYGCAHDTVNGLLGGVVRCEEKHFQQWEPWVMPKIKDL